MRRSRKLTPSIGASNAVQLEWFADSSEWGSDILSSVN